MKKYGKTTTIRRRLSLIGAVLLVSVPVFFARAEERPPAVHVLCYHAFLPKDNQFCFSTAELRSQILTLLNDGYVFVSLRDLMRGNIRGSRNILLTIDDGNRTVYKAYTEVLRPYNIHPVLAIYPSIIGRKRYALTWEQLEWLSNNGCDIAAHGYHHRMMNRRLVDKEYAAFKREIYYSKKVLEEKLKRPIYAFVYPYGVRTGEAYNTLKDAGYRYAFTIDSGGIEIPLRQKYNLYELPRYMLTRNNWRWCFKKIAVNTIYRSPYLVARTEPEAAKRDSRMMKGKDKAELTETTTDNMAERVPSAETALRVKGAEEGEAPRRNAEYYYYDEGSSAQKSYSSGDRVVIPSQERVIPKGDESQPDTNDRSLNRTSGFFSRVIDDLTGKSEDENSIDGDKPLVLEGAVNSGLEAKKARIKKEYFRLTLKGYNRYVELLNRAGRKIGGAYRKIRSFIVDLFK